MSEDEVKKESGDWGAFPAHERVKAEILNRLGFMNESLFGYVNATTKRGKYATMVSGSQYMELWRIFQGSVLALYQYVRPNIHKLLEKKKIDQTTFDRISKLDKCVVDLVAADKELMEPKEWVKIYNDLNDVVYKMGVTEIEMDKTRTDAEI